MKKSDFKTLFSKSKTIYIMAAASFCLAVIAIGVVYSQTMNMAKKILPDISTTKPVHINQTDVTDPREITTTTKQEITAKEKTPTENSLPDTTTALTTTASITQSENISSTAVSVVAQQSFIRPHDGEIIKEYSPDVPMYCETMNDWRTHNGIDIAVKEGDEAVSVGKGKVSRVTVDSSFGYVIEVDYGTFTARYCGMKQGESAKIGQSLEKGDSVGVIDTVPCETESTLHLHFEVLVDGQNENPATICKW